MGSASDQIRVVAEAYSAFAHGDIDALLGLLSEDVAWDATGALWQRGMYTGHDGVREYFSRLDRMWDGLRIEDYEIAPTAPGTFVVQGRLRGYVGGTGQDAPFTHRIEVGPDGRIARLTIVAPDEAN